MDEGSSMVSVDGGLEFVGVDEGSQVVGVGGDSSLVDHSGRVSFLGVSADEGICSNSRFFEPFSSGLEIFCWLTVGTNLRSSRRILFCGSMITFYTCIETQKELLGSRCAIDVKRTSNSQKYLLRTYNDI